MIALHVIFHWNRLGLPAPTQATLAHAATEAIFGTEPPAIAPPLASGDQLKHAGKSALTLAHSDRGWMSGAAGDGIVTIGDPRLKAPTTTIAHPDKATDLLLTMVQRLRHLNGAGLAAPQIGESVRVIVVEVRKTDVFPDRPECPLLQMINPVIVDHSATTVDDWEGCFSVPGLLGQVPRHEAVTVEYLTTDGGIITERYSGYVARVIQHELDHLDGIEFVDRMKSMATLTTVKNHLTYHRNSDSQ